MCGIVCHPQCILQIRSNCVCYSTPRAADRFSRCRKNLATHDRIAFTVSFTRQRERRKGDPAPLIGIELALGCCDRTPSRLTMQECGGALRRKASAVRTGGDRGVYLNLRPNDRVRTGPGQRRRRAKSERDRARHNAIVSAHETSREWTDLSWRPCTRMAPRDRRFAGPL